MQGEVSRDVGFDGPQDGSTPDVVEVTRNYTFLGKYGALTKQGGRFRLFKASNDEAWRVFRRSGIGGSDVAAIMGINSYRTPLDVWLEKTKRKEPDDISKKEPVYWGNILEGPVANRFAEDHRELKISNVFATLVSVSRPWAHANLDRMIVDENGKPGVLEIKTCGISRAHDWDDGIPDYYLTQVTHYLAVTGWTYAYVAVLIGGQDYREFRIERDEEDIKAISLLVDTFWNDYVVKDVMPKAESKDLKELARLHPAGKEYRVELKRAQELDDMVHDYQQALRTEKEAKQEKEYLAAKLEEVIGDDHGIVTDVYKVTWSRSQQRRFDSKRFKADNPSMFETYLKSSMTNRGLQIKELSV